MGRPFMDSSNLVFKSGFLSISWMNLREGCPESIVCSSVAISQRIALFATRLSSQSIMF